MTGKLDIDLKKLKDEMKDELKEEFKKEIQIQIEKAVKMATKDLNERCMAIEASQEFLSKKYDEVCNQLQKAKKAINDLKGQMMIRILNLET